MTHLPTLEMVARLTEYLVSPERKWIADIRGRSRSRKIRRARDSAAGLRQGDTRSINAGDFSDPESERVLDAIADALVEPLARQAARADFAEWLASQKGCR